MARDPEHKADRSSDNPADSDGISRPNKQRAQVAACFQEGGVSVKRFIDVHNGEKRATDHTQYPPDDPRLRGNYGIYGGLGSDEDVPADPKELPAGTDPGEVDVLWLVDVDVDDYNEAEASTNGLDNLPETLTIESPHTDGDSGGHRYYAIQGHVAAAFEERIGVKNPAPTWGEVRVYNQYCVGPGSQIEKGPNGCNKDWCERCSEPDGGYYRIANDCELAVLDLEVFVEAILTDLPNQRTQGQDSVNSAAGQPRSAHDLEPGPGLPATVDIEERLETALECDKTLRQLWHGKYAAAGYPNDRSSAEYALAGKLGWWFGQCPDTVQRLMDRASTQKWCDRPDASYRNSILGVVGGEDYYNKDQEPAATLPMARLGAMDHDEMRQHAKRHGLDWPTTDEARDRLKKRIYQAMRTGEKVVIDAPTSLGKSHTVATEPWLHRMSITNDGPVIHLAPTRDARDENVSKSSAAGVNYARLKGRFERCSVARGDHDPNPDGKDPDVVFTIDGRPIGEWFDLQCDEKGLPFQLAHSYASEYNDQEERLPCCLGESDCPAVAQWDGVPRTDDGDPAYDVVHATHPFAYVPGLRNGCNVVFDESVDFTVDLPQERIRQTVNAYLDAIGAPVRNWEGLVSLAEFEGGEGDAAMEQDELETVLGETPQREWYINHPHAHALAPDLTRAIYRAIRWEKPDANHRRSTTVLHEPPRFDDEEGGYGGNWLTVVIDNQNTVRTVRHAPDLSMARSVIGLDAHPAAQLWQRNAHPRIEVDTILDADERRLWRRLERGLTVVQIGEATRPLSGSDAKKWFAADRKLPVELQALREHYGDGFRTAITTAQVEDDLKQCMETAGIADPEMMHYGAEKSRNEFGDEAVGLINGCMDPGDDYVLDLLAELGLDARPERVDAKSLDEPDAAHCTACSGDGCSECDGTGLKRAVGRAFVGPDEDIAAELLASVRENHIAQAAGRYARAPDDPENTAIVYVRTDATPSGFVDHQVRGTEWLATDLQREIVDTLRETPASTTRELAEAANCTKEHVRQTLVRLEKREIVSRRRGTGDHGADEFQAYVDSERIDDVELMPEETANDHIVGLTIPELAISPSQLMSTVLDWAKCLWPR